MAPNFKLTILLAARSWAETECSALSRKLQESPRRANGLVSDEIRLSPEYQEAKAAYAIAFGKLRALNAKLARERKRHG